MINIVFCLDDKLKNVVFNVINSIKAKTKADVNFYLLLANNFDQHYIKKYKSKGYKVVENVDIPEIKSFNQTLVKSKVMFYRWLIADKIPTIDRAIYLDCDLILNTDIQNLWNIDLCNNIVGMAPCQFGQSIRNTMRYQGSISAEDAYMIYGCDIDKKNYLSGQMLIDLKKWRENNLTKKLIDFVVKYKTADMIALNIICQDNILKLDNLWSAPTKQLNESLQGHPPCIIKDYSKAFIYHFHGKIKPWMQGYPNKKLKKMWERNNEI